jgi:hypothetical protein
MTSYLARLVARAQPLEPSRAEAAASPPPANTGAEWEEIIEMAAPSAPPTAHPPPAERAAPNPFESPDPHHVAVVLKPSSREPAGLPAPRPLEPWVADLPPPFEADATTAGEGPPGNVDDSPVERIPAGPAADRPAPIEILPSKPIRPVAELSPGEPDRPAPAVPIAPADAITPRAIEMRAPALEHRAASGRDEPAIDAVEEQPSVVIGQIRVEVVAPERQRAIAPASVARPARSGTRTPPPARLDGVAPSVQRFGRGQL